MDITGKRIENPEQTLPALVLAAIKTKKKNQSWGEFVLKIVFKDGEPCDIEATDKATFKQ